MPAGIGPVDCELGNAHIGHVIVHVKKRAGTFVAIAPRHFESETMQGKTRGRMRAEQGMKSRTRRSTPSATTQRSGGKDKHMESNTSSRPRAEPALGRPVSTGDQRRTLYQRDLEEHNVAVPVPRNACQQGCELIEAINKTGGITGREERSPHPFPSDEGDWYTADFAPDHPNAHLTQKE
ncbi:hypothetical protein pdul_cds_550 [Pandoravirus dulcis]|uniref:Uncharacterized protein n=1 Tax=Pandoravirus dulcis TaxID=1349409 RepID=A0A291AUB9_9VIRU|nr:hypothetical protein pdul_cds_550 [Pandoravirus dulcis]ATE82527.1 hypothetical protein pdul_cds_550 [Pandoravirus dulcis]